MVLGRHGSALDAQPGRFRLAVGGPDEAGLAESGLAGQEHGAAAAADGLGDQPIEEFEKLVAANEDRAQNGTGAAHGAQSTTRHHVLASVE